jgi:LysR family transcriptional regulator, glycine cleavage system transcriptional activator
MRRLPPLGALAAFEAAARHLSFKAAAAELGVTPTAISHQVRLLEERCGRALFRRRPRPLALTAHGARLFPVMKQGLDSFAAAMAAIAGETEPPRPLRVTTTNAFAHRWLVPRLALWRQAHPDVALEIIGTDAVIDLDADEADLAIRYQRHPPPDLAARELFRDTFWPVCSPALLAAAPVRRAADLARHTLIHLHWQAWEPSPPTWPRWLEAARALDPDAPVAVGADTLSFREELHAIEAVLAGQGIAILSDVLVAPELRGGALVKVLDLPLPGFGFYLAHPPDHPLRAVMESFRAWLRSVA